MIISYREKLLNRIASKPNNYPWNVEPHSKLDEPEESDLEPINKDRVVKIKPNKSLMRGDWDKHFINWENINQLNLPYFEEKQQGESANAK